jgi:alkylation response protein AidB-like acyl-CoA dehydrogenase
MSLISGKLCTDRQSVYRELNNSDEIEAIHTPPDKELVRQYGEMGFLGINTGKQYRKAIRGFDILQAVVNEAILCVCAEGVGIIRALHDKTVQYCKDRVQFGRPIGKFQALQHRLVNSLMACEQSRSLLMWSAMANASDSEEAVNSIHALKYQLGTAGVQVASEALQLHGRMGMTWELDVGHYFKRMTAISILFGDADYHLNRYLA